MIPWESAPGRDSWPSKQPPRRSRRQREKLLKLYYADALGVETIRQERERIDSETSGAERELKQANAALDEQRRRRPEGRPL